MSAVVEKATPSLRAPSHHVTLYLPGESFLCGLGNFPLWPFCIFRSINCHTGPVTNFFRNLANLSCAVETPPCNLTSSLRRFFHIFGFNYFSAWTRPAGSGLNQAPPGRGPGRTELEFPLPLLPGEAWGLCGGRTPRGTPRAPRNQPLGQGHLQVLVILGGNAW